MKTPLRRFPSALLKHLERLLRLKPPALPGVQVRIELQNRLLPVLCMVSLGWYLLSPNEVSACVFTALAGLLLGGWLWARTYAAHITAGRRLQYSAFQVGDEMEELITLENRSGLPLLWCELNDQTSLPGHAVAGVRAANPHSVNRWRFNTTCTRRGVFRLGPWQLASGDPFGIFRVTHTYQQREELLVYPPLAKLPPQLMPHSAAFGEHRPLRQALPADTVQAFSTRRYQPGDPLRRIHWKTSAHRSELYVKLLDPEASSTVWLLPDLDHAVQLGDGDESTLEVMLVLLATLAHLLLRENLAVGLYAHGAERIVVPPLRGRASIWRLLRSIAPLQVVTGQPLAHTLNEARPLIGAHDTLVILTPSLDPGWPRQVSAHARGQPVQVLLFDPLSFGGEGDVQAFRSLLASQGLNSAAVRRGDIQPIQASYGALRRWEFKTLSSGRVLVLRTPRSAESASRRPGGADG